jgi:hypothetical protein
MTKAPIDLQELRRRIFRKAKSEKEHRFWGICVHMTKIEKKRSVGWRRWSNEYLYGVLGLFWGWKIHPLPGALRHS